MTASTAPTPERRAHTRPAPRFARRLGLLLIALNCVLLLVLDLPFEQMLRGEIFDAYQRAFPRVRTGDPVVVVEIDERSLREIGQWPWPRARLAQLIERLIVGAPAAIAIDALFVEPDRFAPTEIVRQLALPPAALGPLERHLPDSDRRLAAAIRGSPVILGVAAVTDEAGVARGQAPAATLRTFGGDPAQFVRHYPALLQSLPVIAGAARGQALLNSEPERGVHRRVPALAAIGGGTLLPGLAVETLRVVSGGAIAVETGRNGVERLGIADIEIPVEANGDWWLHFSAWAARPTLSAADVLAGSYAPELVEGRIVLIGYTALGLQDIVTTPLGRMPGVALHAEAIENALAGRLLSRPTWTGWLEFAAMTLLSLVAALGAPALGPARALALVALGAMGFVAVALSLFVSQGVLVDAVNPLAGVGLVLFGVLGGSLAEVQLQRRLLREQLGASRDAQQRMQGELDTARRIQIGMLPRAETLAGTPGLELAAFSEPARTVGGDLYDFFFVGSRRLFFVVGDVSGKGLPSALLMALAKALIKSSALRADGDPGAALTAANDAIAQDNPELLFVTVFAACLDLDSGALLYANAGHEGPLRIAARRVRAGPGACGPPLCTVDAFHYDSLPLQLARGEALCVYTDGITDARAMDDAMFGKERLLACVGSLPAGTSAQAMMDAIGDAVRAHAGNTEQTDDMTVLVVARC
jgi:adenylate cyclase